MKEFEYIENLKRESLQYRKACLEHMRRTYQDGMDYQMIRRASWTYSNHFRTIPKDQVECDWPVPIATSYTDIFHQSHFIRAFLASVFLPNESLLEDEVTCAPVVQVAINETQRYETRALVFQKLVALIPEGSEGSGPRPDTSKPNTLKPPKKKAWKESVLDTLKDIQTKVGDIHASVLPKGKEMDPERSRRSKLPSKK